MALLSVKVTFLLFFHSFFDNQALLLNNSSGGGNSIIYDSENNFTIEFWVKPKYPHEIDEESNWGTAGLSGQKYVIFPGSGGDGYGSRAGAGISVGTNGVSVYEHADSYLPAVLVWQSDTTITSWMHVAVVYTNGRPSLYINGQFRRQGVQSGRGHVFASTQFPGGYTSAEGGQLDELRIWKVSRTEQQIRDNMNGEIPGNTPNLAGYWPMNEGSGNVLHDVSGNGRDVGLNGSYGAGNWTAGRYSVELSSNYRYAFNGKELDPDLGQDDYAFEARIYDARLSRFLSTDPLEKKYPDQSPYVFAHNNPVLLIDYLGMGDPEMNLDSRHLISGGKFNAKDVNSVIINPKWQDKSVLKSFYDEAVGLVKQIGKTEKDVTLANGSVWNVNVKTGHFYPVSSTDGSIVNLSKAEMQILQGATSNGAKGETLFQNIFKGLKGRNSGTLSTNMESALTALAETEGVSTGVAVKSIAGYLPSTPVPPPVSAAATSKFGKALKYVKWGGKALVVVAVAADIYEVYNSENKIRTIVTKAGGWAGASAGASGGAAVGAWFAGWGAIPGAIIGGVGGYFAGESITEVVYDHIFTPVK